MTFKKRLCATILSLVAGALIVAVLLWRPKWASVTGLIALDPSIACPTEVDVGEHEAGDWVEANFLVENTGRQGLVLNDFRSSCSCTGIARREGTRIETVSELIVQPGKRIELTAQINVRGPAGSSMRTRAAFRTNDPLRPEVGIDFVVAKVKRGITPVPAGVFVGTVPVGERFTQTIIVHDWAVTPRAIERVTVSNPSRLTAVFVSIVEPHSQDGKGSQARAIGRIEVTVNTQAPGPIDETIQIHLPTGAHNPDVIRVTGRVQGDIEVAPPRLALPIASSNGPLYSGRCLCRSPDGKPFAMVVESCSDGLTATVHGGDETGTKVVHITWLSSRGVAGEHSTRVVRLKATIKGKETFVDIPVDCRDEL